MEPGNLTIVLGDDEAKAMLRVEPVVVDTWLSGLVNEISDFAAERLRAHAPGRIDALVDSVHDELGGVGVREAVAGVLPDITEAGFYSGLGSDPADFPVYVDQGTGVFGEHGKAIRVIPGNVMAFEHNGQRLFRPVVQGQRAQHFSAHAFEDTVGWTTVRVEAATRELATAHPG